MFNFNQKREDTFNELKNRFISALVLVIYSPAKTTELPTYESKYHSFELKMFAIIYYKASEFIWKVNRVLSCTRRKIDSIHSLLSSRNTLENEEMSEYDNHKSRWLVI